MALLILKAFPSAPIYTALYDPAATYPEFAQADVRPFSLNRVGFLRENHRLALPFLARAHSKQHIDADVVLCCSWGWAHGVKTNGRKIVYCYSPARWLYQTESYLGPGASLKRAALLALRKPLVRWDKRQAATADRYLTLSTCVGDRIRSLYQREAEVIFPPPMLDKTGHHQAVPGIEEGFHLCVSRLLPYKNVDAVVRAFASLPNERLVVAGKGPEEGRIRAQASVNVQVLGSVSDEQLRWLYKNCRSVIAASYEDYGLTPLEGAIFGKPAAALRWGGFLDTIVEGTTGIYFSEPGAEQIAEAINLLLKMQLPPEPIKNHARRFSAESFTERLQEVVAEEYLHRSVTPKLREQGPS